VSNSSKSGNMRLMFIRKTAFDALSSSLFLYIIDKLQGKW